MAPLRFLDANLLLRYFTLTDPDKSACARELLERVERREENVVSTVLVVFEIVCTLERTYKLPNPRSAR